MEFENPKKLSLNRLFLEVKEGGVQKKYPAIDKYWIEDRPHLKYIPLPIENNKIHNDNGLLDEWLSEMDWFNKEMSWILELECHRFWSHLIYDSTVIESILSFLQEATPAYIPIISLTSDIDVIKLYSTILENVLMIVCRLITNKESEFEWLDKKYIAEILYTKYIVSIPMIFDLISTYGRSNNTILTQIIETILKIEPKYQHDLEMGIKYLQMVLRNLQHKIETENSIKILEDITLHLLDSSFTLNVLVDISNESKLICSKLKMEQSISNFYECAITNLYHKIYKINKNSIGLTNINQARMELLSAFRKILSSHLETIDKNSKNPEKCFFPSEMFLNVFTEIITDKTFLLDYNRLHTIESDLAIIKSVCPKIDSFKIDFILKGILLEDIDDLVQAENEFNEEKITNNINGFNHSDDQELILPSSSSSTQNNNSATIEQDVKRVIDVLPHLGDGFVRKLLSRYDNVEQAIAAVLEGNLPPDLNEANQSEPYIPPDLKDTAYVEVGIQRVNIYDGDKYDVMTQKNLDGIVKIGKGKPGEPKTLKALLDDKSHVQSLKMRYQEYSMVTEETDDYDDEYDDSYDALAESETKKSKKLAAAKNITVDEIEDDESESSEEESEGVKGPSKNFCENPEVIRARYEQKRQTFMMKKRGGGSGGGGGAGQSRDVVGKAKGQGQDDKTIHARHSKDVNKSSRGNHNRKRGATWKHSRGMVPF